MRGYKYYFAALAAYRDKDSLKVFEEFLNQPTDSGVHRAAENRLVNLR